MADNQTNERTPQGALVPTERPDAASQVANQNLDPSKGRVAFWSSMTPATAREKALLYNAMVGQVAPINKMIDETIVLENVVLQGIDLTNPVTGELTPAIRVVLIDIRRKMYGCVSKGIHESIKKLIGIMGMPPWTAGVPVIVRSNKAKVGNYYTLEMELPEEDQPPPTVTAKPEQPPKSTAKK